MYDKVLEYRQTKPIFLMDFWNDGGIIQWLCCRWETLYHINARGDVEPCAFVRHANCNIKDVSLKEALGSPLMRAYQKRHPFNVNMGATMSPYR